MLYSFLMIGQSNMAGRGHVNNVKQIYNDNIKTLVNGRWQTMFEPINFDRPTSGIGLAASFAGSWCLKNNDKQIGLIPCADGGTSLDDWAVDGILFENALYHAKIAQKSSALTGILWHQGENDSFNNLSDVYYDKLSLIIDAFRQKLNLLDTPFIAGGLGDYLTSGRYGQYFTEYNLVNQALRKIAKEKHNCFFVTADGLTANVDGLHFDAVSQRKFGLRYFEAFDRKKSVLSPLHGESEKVMILENRPLTKTENIALLEINFGAGKLSSIEFEHQLALINSPS
jgi:hypothetical protein